MAHNSDFSLVYATPTDGLNPWEVARALNGVNSEDIGTLCSHANINKWNVNKPIIYPTWVWATDADRQNAYKNVGYGLSYPRTYPDASALYEYMQLHRDTGVIALEWGYARPTGGAQSPYRLIDFDGYQRTAHVPEYGNQTIVIGFDPISGEIAYHLPQRTDNNPIDLYNLKLSQLSNRAYPTFICRPIGLSAQYVFSSPVTEGGVPLPVGNYLCAVGVSDRQRYLTSGNVNGLFVPMPKGFFNLTVDIPDGGFYLYPDSYQVIWDGIKYLSVNNMMFAAKNSLISNAKIHFRFDENCWVDDRGQWRVTETPDSDEQTVSLSDLDSLTDGVMVVDAALNRIPPAVKDYGSIIVTAAVRNRYFGIKLNNEQV